MVVSRLGEDYLEWRRAVIRLREAAAVLVALNSVFQILAFAGRMVTFPE